MHYFIKTDLKSMNFANLKIILKNEPDYRYSQARQLIFKDLIQSWSQASFFPKDLRRKLEKNFLLQITAKVFPDKSRSTTKALLTLKDGLKIETVLIKHEDNRRTVCLSCMVGCPVGCTFCATGKMGFKRNLSWSEIVIQILFWQRLLKKAKEKVTNIVFMGMGEPFLNFEPVWKAVEIINHPDFFNIGARRISISTVGIPKTILKLAKKKLQVNLAVSLHAPNNQLRLKLIPLNRQYPIEAILRAVKSYVNQTKRRVMFEYILIEGINDQPQQAVQLAKLLDHYLYFVNLIPYNPTGVYQRSKAKNINRFKTILQKNHLPFTQRYLFGDKIQGACGQLAGEA